MHAYLAEQLYSERVALGRAALWPWAPSKAGVPLCYIHAQSPAVVVVGSKLPAVWVSQAACSI